jgi:hypothetical protein
MLRYKLRTLLIVLALGPPVLAFLWVDFEIAKELAMPFLWLIVYAAISAALSIGLFVAYISWRILSRVVWPHARRWYLGRSAKKLDTK